MILSGQKTVTAAGTAVALGNQVINGLLVVKALAGNTGLVYVGNNGSGDVASSNGFELTAKEEVRFNFVGNLSEIIVDAATNDDAVCWIALNV